MIKILVGVSIGALALTTLILGACSTMHAPPFRTNAEQPVEGTLRCDLSKNPYCKSNQFSD